MRPRYGYGASTCEVCMSEQFRYGRLTCYRKWPRRHTHPPAHLPQAHPRRSTEPITRRNMGAHVRLVFLAPTEPQPLHGHTSKVLRERVLGYRRDREGPESKSSRVPRLSGRGGHWPAAQSLDGIQLDERGGWVLSGYEYRCGSAADVRISF
jgi:hypothetical protein